MTPGEKAHGRQENQISTGIISRLPGLGKKKIHAEVSLITSCDITEPELGVLRYGMEHRELGPLRTLILELCVWVWMIT